MVRFWYLFAQTPGKRVREVVQVGRWGYGVWLAQGVLLNLINLPVIRSQEQERAEITDGKVQIIVRKGRAI